MCYLDLESLQAAVNECAEEAGVERFGGFDSSCFDGVYVTGDIDEKYFADLHLKRKFTLMHPGFL